MVRFLESRSEVSILPPTQGCGGVLQKNEICNEQWHIREEKELFRQKICRNEIFCVLLLRVFCTAWGALVS